jgi:FAD/FMN-containing dehydrogenase
MRRRGFLVSLFQLATAVLTVPAGFCSEVAGKTRTLLNDIHSKLNPTYVDAVITPVTTAKVQDVLRRARETGKAVSIAGGRHAMGGQQFGTDTLNIDTRKMSEILKFDAARGLIEIEAGIQWPELIAWLIQNQAGDSRQWGIRQKQTGADRLCLGGALGANVHGRGLRFKPVIDDVESFRLVDAMGRLLNCSRQENTELFSLAIGGYGLFGVITTITLRLMPRTKLERIVRLTDTTGLIEQLEKRVSEGYLYGDFQFSIDPSSDAFLTRGVFSCYRPVDISTPVPNAQKSLGADDWSNLYLLAHNNPGRLFDLYTNYYLSTSGQIYWSDTHQLSSYTDDYHVKVDQQIETGFTGTEMITEVYVPRNRLEQFLRALAGDFRRHSVQVIYGTIRLIEKDDESFLPWARESFACIVMNLHVTHRPQGIVKAERDFQRVIDRAIEYGGSYFLTYHRWARRDQIEQCYPQLQQFLALKRKYDPQEVFQSDWYRHYRDLLS